MSCNQVLHDRSLVIGDRVLSLHADLAPVPTAAGQARVLVASALSGGAGRMVDDELIYRAQLVASELVTNAVLHARTTVGLGICHDGHRLLIAVADGAPGNVIDLTQRPAIVSGVRESGRGMTIVAQLADDFGWRTRTESSGKIMWAVIALTQEHSAYRAR